MLKDGEQDVRGHEDRHFWPHASCGGLGDRVLCVPSREHSHKASKLSCFPERGSHFSGAGTEARDRGVFTSVVPSELPLDVNYGKYKGNEFRYLMEMGLCLLHHRVFLFFLEWVFFFFLNGAHGGTQGLLHARQVLDRVKLHPSCIPRPLSQFRFEIASLSFDPSGLFKIPLASTNLLFKGNR